MLIELWLGGFDLPWQIKGKQVKKDIGVQLWRAIKEKKTGFC